MPEPYLSIAQTLLLLVIYYWSYVIARKHLRKKDTMWSIVFVVNFAYLVWLVAVFQPMLFRRLGIDSTLVQISIDAMTVGAILHHLSIMLKKKKSNSRILNLTHFQISHLLLTIPVLINGANLTVVFLKNSSGYMDLLAAMVFVVAGIAYLKFVFSSGFNKMMKVPYSNEV